MKRQLIVEYWWECDKFKKIPDELQDALEETAEDVVNAMIDEGYVEGQLQDYVNMKIKGRKTPEDGWYCRGGWTIKRYTPEE